MSVSTLMLTILNGDQAGGMYYLPEDRSVTIGRAHGAVIRIPSDALSGIHATLRSHAGIVYLQDLNSTNGTYIDNRRVTEATLLPGQTFRMADVKCQIDQGESLDDSDPFDDQLEMKIPLAMRETEDDIPAIPNPNQRSTSTPSANHDASKTLRMPPMRNGTPEPDTRDPSGGADVPPPDLYSDGSDEFDKIHMDIPLLPIDDDDDTDH